MARLSSRSNTRIDRDAPRRAATCPKADRMRPSTRTRSTLRCEGLRLISIRISFTDRPRRSGTWNHILAPALARGSRQLLVEAELGALLARTRADFTRTVSAASDDVGRPERITPTRLAGTGRPRSNKPAAPSAPGRLDPRSSSAPTGKHSRRTSRASLTVTCRSRSAAPGKGQAPRAHACGRRRSMGRVVALASVLRP